MRTLRDIAGQMSFRRRLLLLILAVSMLQVGAALATFRDTQSAPQRLRYDAQLNDAVGKVFVGAINRELAGPAAALRAVTADRELPIAVARDDRAAIERMLAAHSSAHRNQSLYLTDAHGKVIAGSKPTSPIIDAGTVELDGPAGERRRVHAPLVLGSSFLGKANKLTSMRLVAIDGSGTVTARGTAPAPDALSEDVRKLQIDGREHRVMLREVNGTFLGAGVPAAELAGAQAEGRRQLWLFFAALVSLSVLVAYIITSSVDGALSVFSSRARRVADGHLDERLPVIGDDEVAGASEAFNQMAQALKERIEGLEHAEARLERQVRLFGDVLTSEDSIERKLEAVCRVATETTTASQARFWLRLGPQFRMMAAVDLTIEHDRLSRIEATALRERRIVSHSEPGLSVIVVPALCDDECAGLLTLCSTDDPLTGRDGELAGRLAAQAAVSIDNFRMHEALKDENRYLADTFSQYVPASVVEQLLERGEEIELGGQQREVSVLFCDIRGFTSWSEALPPTQVVHELNELLAVLSDCVFETDGTLDKFTGDGLMALWGAPLDQPDHADRACRAALLMVERLRKFNEAKGVDAFRVGIGIHSGPAVVGNIGHARRHDYTAIGDTVNLSARIEAATKDLGASLLVSQATVDRLSGMPGVFDRVGPIRVKGRAEAVVVHRLVDAVEGRQAA